MLSDKAGLSSWFFRAIFLIPLMLVLWWGLLVDGYLVGLRHLADFVLPHLFSKGVHSIQPFQNGGWLISTGLNVIGKNPPEEFLFQLDKVRYLNRTVMGVPLLWALILASKRNFTGAIVWGSLLQTIICLLGISAYIWGVLAEVLSPGDALFIRVNGAPDLMVAGKPYSSFWVFLASVAFFGQTLTIPVIAPLLVWGIFCANEIKGLVGIRW